MSQSLGDSAVVAADFLPRETTLLSGDMLAGQGMVEAQFQQGPNWCSVPRVHRGLRSSIPRFDLDTSIDESEGVQKFRKGSGVSCEEMEAEPQW